MFVFEWIIIYWRVENILHIINAGEGVVKMIE
jgi:hypothetical protein